MRHPGESLVIWFGGVWAQRPPAFSKLMPRLAMQPACDRQPACSTLKPCLPNSACTALLFTRPAGGLPADGGRPPGL